MGTFLFRINDCCELETIVKLFLVLLRFFFFFFSGRLLRVRNAFLYTKLYYLAQYYGLNWAHQPHKLMKFRPMWQAHKKLPKIQSLETKQYGFCHTLVTSHKSQQVKAWKTTNSSRPSPDEKWERWIWGLGSAFFFTKLLLGLNIFKKKNAYHVVSFPPLFWASWEAFKWAWSPFKIGTVQKAKHTWKSHSKNGNFFLLKIGF